eukprot:TRINITY_DN3652_c0_g2_i1.p3 TRINITY_DN3652_c0_g2~~TRINITY_DN3652_c0_g2_i1.p3  ORF type:complete len:123 (-),score=14.98 TRINITY_DN3652_c0_g2_i1:130-498(-)
MCIRDRKKDTGEILALQIFNKNKAINTNELDCMLTKWSLMKTLSTPFCLQPRYTLETPEKLYFITEGYPGRDLFFYLQRKRRFEEELVKFFSAQIISAIADLHKNNICNIELKPEKLSLIHI